MMAHYAARLRTVSSAELCLAAPSPIQNKTKKVKLSFLIVSACAQLFRQHF